jgi:hypothetical protein
MLFGLGDHSNVRWLPAAPRPPTPLDEVHVWRAWLDREGWPEQAALPGEERRRAAAIQIDGRRRRWVAARWALRLALSHYTGADPAEHRLESGDRGKPGVAGRPELRFNLSHSGELTLIAFTAAREVGIDVERVEPDRPNGYYRDWVRREAVAKCTGSGLGGPPPDGPVSVSDLDPGPGWVAALALDGAVELPRRLFELDPPPGG